MRAPQFIKRGVQRVAASDRFASRAPKIVPRVDRVVSKLTRGKVLLSDWIVPAIVLTSTGARSGQPRRSPVAAVPHDDDYFIVASNFGQTNHPAWSYNLMANPSAKMTLHGHEHDVEAILLTSEQKTEVWPELLKVWPPFDRYVERSGRDLRVFRLVEV